MINSVDPDQTAHMSSLIWVNAVLFLYLKYSIMFGNYLQQTTSADDIFRCIFFLGPEWLSWSHTLAINCLVIEFMLQEM